MYSQNGWIENPSGVFTEVTNSSGDINNPLFKSNLYLNGKTGELQARTGYIGGFTIHKDMLQSTHGTTPSISLNGITGKLIANDATIRGHIEATSGTFAGSLSAATGTFSGELTAVTGAIGGFNIINSVLKSSNNNLTLDAINALITTGSGNTRIEMGMKNSVPVLQFYKNGTLQYDLGPDGIELKDGGTATINGTTTTTITLAND
jgi:hypothetical protein